LAGKVAAGESTYCTKSIDMAVAAAYSALIEHAKAVLVNQLAAQTEATYELLDRFHRQYQLLKRQSRSLRFEDITVQLAERLMASPAAAGESTRSGYERLVFRLDAQLHHLLLDEFQDTSLAQWAVIKPFATRIAGAEHHTDRSKAVRSVTAVKGRSREKGQRSQIGQRPVFQSFFCVGDTKQAIYGWRGGVAEIFDAVTHELAGIQQRPLDTSWRSSPHVIRAVNEIFGNLQRHGNLGDLGDAVSSWQRQFNEHQTAPSRQKLNGYVCLQAARQPDDEEAESQNDITLRFAAQQVAEWKARAPGFDVGVLVRRNVAVRRLIYELRELGIEASEEGGSSLTDSAAVRLVLSLVRLADHPGDLVARFHIATSPLADPLGLLADVASDEQAPDSAGRVHQAAVPFAARQGDVAAGRLARQLRRRLVEEGYGPTVDFLARQLAPACSRRESRRLEKLIGLAYQYDDAATSRPSDFAAFVDASKVRDPIAADVRVMTVHQAKGLEFDIVVLTELEANLIGQRSDLVVGRPAPTQPIDRVCRRCHKALQELLPESWQALFREADEQDVAESLCVLYVAVTRARHALQMIVAPSADNEKSLHKTFGGLLRAALTDGRPLAPRQLAYETGDPQWYRNPGVERQPSAGTVALQAESLVPLEVCLAAARDRRWRGLQRVSPSGLEGGTHVRLADVRSAGSGDRAAALAYGTLIHAWFQQIRWLDDGPPDEQRLREVAAELSDLALSRADIDQRLIEFQAMLDNPDMAACLRRSRYGAWTGATPNVETERPIAVREGNRLLVGSIDRLVTIFRGSQPVAAEIMDFKTDALAGADERAVEAKVNFYRPQLSAYRLAVCTIFGLEPHQVSAKLLFVGTGTMADV
jgi:ATP-dependent exoDNAse (exonuclease V) beta subunit